MKRNIILLFTISFFILLIYSCNLFKPSVTLKEGKYFLNLSEKGLDTIPNFVLEEERLQILILNYNEFTTVPIELFNLTNLEGLHLRGNKLKTIPKEIVRLKKLEILNLMETNIEYIPIEIKELTSLKKLLLIGHNLDGEQINGLKKSLPSTEIILYTDSRLNQYID